MFVRADICTSVGCRQQHVNIPIEITPPYNREKTKIHDEMDVIAVVSAVNGVVRAVDFTTMGAGFSEIFNRLQNIKRLGGVEYDSIKNGGCRRVSEYSFTIPLPQKISEIEKTIFDLKADFTNVEENLAITSPPFVFNQNVIDLICNYVDEVDFHLDVLNEMYPQPTSIIAINASTSRSTPLPSTNS